jgi:hypothetical protein
MFQLNSWLFLAFFVVLEGSKFDFWPFAFPLHTLYHGVVVITPIPLDAKVMTLLDLECARHVLACHGPFPPPRHAVWLISTLHLSFVAFLSGLTFVQSE